MEFLNDYTKNAVWGMKCNAYTLNSVVIIEGQIVYIYFQVSSFVFWLTATLTS